MLAGNKSCRRHKRHQISDRQNHHTVAAGRSAGRTALKTNTALQTLDLHSNNIGAEQANELIVIMTSKPNLKTLCGFSGDETKLDLSNKGLSAGCAVLVANEVKNNGAMVSVNMMGNKISKEQFSKLQEMMQAHPALVSLCGIADEATEANLSGLGMDADDAAILTDELPAKGALTNLNISTNSLGGYLDANYNWIFDISGVTALAAAIPECRYAQEYQDHPLSHLSRLIFILPSGRWRNSPSAATNTGTTVAGKTLPRSPLRRQ